MAYHAVPTQNVGDDWTAAEHNTYIRDNFAAGVPDIFTAKGDIAAATAADAASPLAVGTDGQVLTAASGADTGLAWSSAAIPSMTAARYVKGSEQTVANGSTVVIDFDTVDFDPDSLVTAGAGWHFHPKDAGYFMVTAGVYIKSSAYWGANEQLQLWLYKNNEAVEIMGGLAMQSAGTYVQYVNGTALSYCSATTDYLDVRLNQNSGSDAVIDDLAGYSHIAIARIF